MAIGVSPSAADNSGQLLVYFDGGCPVCRFEVGHYAKLDQASAIAWIDILALGPDGLPYGKTKEDLLGRFHVQDGSGQWHVGVDAFARIWQALPGFRHFAWLFRTPGIRQCAKLGYRLFLAWQRRDRRRREGQPTKLSHSPN